MKHLRIVTYNIHKCVGIDGKFSPARIAEVLNELEADVIGLQEVLCVKGKESNEDQAAFLAAKLGLNIEFGGNREIDNSSYGNATLTKFVIREYENFDISIDGYEKRGCLRTQIEIERSEPLEFFNVHLGTSYFERRKQVDRLLAKRVLDYDLFTENRIIAGDFNEWTKGKTTKLFKKAFRTVEAKPDLGKRKTYPGIFPIFHLDHIYFDADFKLKRAFVYRSKTALKASDHLPIVADFGYE